MNFILKFLLMLILLPPALLGCAVLLLAVLEASK